MMLRGMEYFYDAERIFLYDASRLTIFYYAERDEIFFLLWNRRSEVTADESVSVGRVADN